MHRRMPHASWLVVCLGMLLAAPARPSSTREFVDLALNGSNAPRVVSYDYANFFVRLGVFSASSTWDCYTLQGAPLMGGATHIASGLEGVAVVDAGGTPYVAYTVDKILDVEHPADCGNV